MPSNLPDEEEDLLSVPDVDGFQRLSGFSRLTPIEVDRVASPRATNPADRFIPRSLFAIHTVVVAQDGSADFQNIQDAIDILPSTGGLVIIKEGTYEITESIDLNKDNITLKGVSWGAKIDIDGITSFLGIGIDCTNNDNLVIENLQIIDSGSGGTAMRFTNCNNSVIRNCFINNVNDGILIDNSDNVTVDNNYVKDATGDFGINIRTTSENCKITDNRLDTSNIVIEGGDKNIITNNLFSGFADDGEIHLFSAANNNVISNNIIFGSSGAYAIWLENGNDYNVITGNRCSGKTTGIEIEAGSDKTLVTSNNCVGCTNTVVDNGTSTTAANNTN